MRKITLFSTGLLAATALTACGSGLGEPQAPTSNQTQAAKQLDGSTDQIVQIKGKPDSAFSLYGTIAAIGPSAVDPTAKNRSGLYYPQDLPSGCVTGDANSGYTYKCPQVEGSVSFSGTTTNIDLKILGSGGGVSAEVTLKGSVSNDGTSIKGDLTSSTKVNLGISLPGIPSADVTTHVNYDVSYKANPACVTAGKILVEYTAATQSGKAQFEYSGCNTFKVRNS